jgi:NAD+ synthase (glutamine-hydrolysing)
VSTAPHGFLRVGAACPRVWVADPARNAEEILRFVEAARSQGTQLLVFPELSLTGYTAGDLFFSLSTLVGGAERALAGCSRPRPPIA